MIPVPSLDTIDFDALVEEGRALIPRFAPNWTDHNLHDPGITLLDLMAWVIDQQVYRIGSVGDAHLRAFAALLGVHPDKARPARGLLWPPPDAPTAERILPAGTQLSPVHQPDLIFTTPEVRLTRACPDMIARAGGEQAQVRPDRGGAFRLDPATDTLELRLDRPLFADAAAASTLALGLEFAAVLPDFGTDMPPPIAFDYRTGDGLWHPAESRWIEGPARRSAAALLAVAAGHGGVDALRLGFAASPVRALPTRAALNVLPAVQIETLPAIALRDAHPDAHALPDLELTYGAGALPVDRAEGNTLSIRTLGPDETIEWRAVDDISGSGPDDNIYVLDEARATIRFGNGVNGRMPPADHQIVRDALDVTVGAQGNVVAGVAWDVQGLAAGPTHWTNREPIAGGCDAWDREALLTALRRRSRQRSAMLGDSELRDAAASLRGFGIERAEVIPRFLPTLPNRPVPGARTLLLHPGDGVAGGDAWVEAIERRLASRRVLGERLSLAAAEPVAIAVAADVLIAAGSDAPRIEEDVLAALRARLAASRKSPKIAPWPSGRPVTIGELEALVAGVEGVVAVPRLRVGGRGDSPDEMSVPLARLEVAVAGKIELALRVEA